MGGFYAYQVDLDRTILADGQLNKGGKVLMGERNKFFLDRRQPIWIRFVAMYSRNAFLRVWGSHRLVSSCLP